MEANSATTGFPELTELGKRIEMLRIERGLSKQHLARHAGTSRQQLWRVMTGKSELTLGLRARLADALGVQMVELDGNGPLTMTTTVASLATGAPIQMPPAAFADYVRDPAGIARTLATLPSDEGGVALKRRLLDSIEDRAMSDGIVLNAAFFELRRRVITRDL
jgi:transcriptional regulator with XRE-family HTH domain